jgi:hypothetical protein
MVGSWLACIVSSCRVAGAARPTARRLVFIGLRSKRHEVGQKVESRKEETGER